jgi:TatD DNase family protein
MTLCDSHAHAGNYFDDILYMLKEDKLYVVLNTTSSLDFEQTLRLARSAPRNIRLFAGVHPAMAEEGTARISSLIDQNINFVSGIGEIGLDSRNSSPTQIRTFLLQLELAERLRKPISVHSRGMVHRVLQELSSFKISNVLLHWFDAEEKYLNEAVSRGYFVSFGPATTYSKRLKRLAQSTPIENLLAETDSPVRYGAVYESREADPRLVSSVIFTLALIKGYDVEELEEAVFNNFKRFIRNDA